MTAALANSTADAGAASWRAALARTLHGMTWRRFAIVGVAAAGHAIAMTLMPGKTLRDGAKVFAWEYAYLLVFFGTVGVAVIVTGNWAPARTGPRVVALVAAVVVGLVAGTVLADALIAFVYPNDKGAPPLLKQIAAILLWSHVADARLRPHRLDFARDRAQVSSHFHPNGRGERGMAQCATSAPSRLSARPMGTR